VIHVVSPANTDYQASLVREEQRNLGDTVGAVWRKLLRRPDRFDSLDSAAFLDPAVTSSEYVDRYSGPVT
jgi:hypothetical protein